jgi:hypothetical protein
MKDILLTKDGDISISETGDITLTDSIIQAVRIRLLWFFEEWRFAPDYGISYYEEILVKNPNTEQIKRLVRDEVMTVNEVSDVKNITVSIDRKTRKATVSLEIVTAEKTYREELLIDV